MLFENLWVKLAVEMIVFQFYLAHSRHVIHTKKLIIFMITDNFAFVCFDVESMLIQV